jgi:hypothetical protein
VKLLVDEMYPPIVAQRLRDEHAADAVSVLERPDLRGRPDSEIFDAAQREQRVIVTENVRDYVPFARSHQAAGGVHYGLALTTNRRFPRAQPDTVSRIVDRLVSLLAKETADPVASNREIWL